MAVSDNRVIPLASVRLYDPGQGDAIVTDNGFRFYEPMSRAYPNGSVSRDTTHQNTLEYIEEVGLVCRPFLVLQHTRKSHFTCTGGSWEERRPSTGSPRKYRLVQYSAEPNTTWSAQSTYSVPQNPSLAFSLVFLDAPADNDFEVYPPYVQLELGNGEWAVRFHKTEGAALYQRIDGVLQPVMEIDDPQVIVGSDAVERLITLRCQRGKIGISTDNGRKYNWFSYPDGRPATIPQGKITLRGQGGACYFGLHQLLYKRGTFTSPARNTFTSRPLGTPTITGRIATPTGTGVTFANASSGTYAQYRATLNPAPRVATPFVFYTSPELYAVQFAFPVLRSVTLGTYSTPWDGDIHEVVIDKQYELSSSSCTITIRKDASTQFVGNYRWRKVAVYLGEEHEDETSSMVLAFVGYIKRVEVKQDTYGRAFTVIELENASIRPRRQIWDDFACIPLGGMTVNQALDVILGSMGLDVSYRSWHAKGDLFVLPAGSPEEPFLWVQPGDTKWDTMQQIARYAGLEIAVTDTGGFISGPLEYVDTFISHAFEADPSSGSENARYAIQKATYTFDSGEAQTMVLIRGTDEWGNAIYSYGVDVAAESNPSNYRFCPWRETYREEVENSSTVPALMMLAAAKYNEQCALKFDAEIEVPVNLDVLRRQRVTFNGLTVGIADTDQFVVLTIRHTYLFDPSFSTMATTLGVRRLGA